MNNENENPDASEISSSFDSSYSTNKITRRSALQRLGLMTGVASIMGFTVLHTDLKAEAAEPTQTTDLAVHDFAATSSCSTCGNASSCS